MMHGSDLVKLGFNLHHVCLHIIDASPADRRQSHAVNQARSLVTREKHEPQTKLEIITED